MNILINAVIPQSCLFFIIFEAGVKIMTVLYQSEQSLIKKTSKWLLLERL